MKKAYLWKLHLGQKVANIEYAFYVSYLIIVHTASGPQPAAFPSSVSR
jgi:hypothetical protein